MSWHREKLFADCVLERSPLQWAFQRIARSKLVILAYHGVDDLANFRRQLDYILGSRTPISLQQLVDAIYANAALPPRPVLITFDDGYRSVYELGAQELEKRRVPAAIFVVTSLLGTTRPFWWEEVEALLLSGARARGLPPSPSAALNALKRAPNDLRLDLIDQLRAASSAKVTTPQLTSTELRHLEAAGIEVGSHTHTHPCLDRCDPRTIDDEIRTSTEELQKVLGARPRAFAYPNGNYHPLAEHELRALDYQVGFLFDHHVCEDIARTPLRLSRLRVSTATPAPRFATILSGLHPAIHSLRQAADAWFYGRPRTR